MPFNGTNVLKYQKMGRKALVTLNRPEVLNALNGELMESIVEAMAEADRDGDILAVIMPGEGGRAFSAGADLKEMSQRDSATGAPVTGRSAGRADGFGAVRDCRKPVVAAIDGYCVAGGFELSLMCDIRVASEHSQFGLPEPRRSLLAGPGLHNLSRMIPLGEALLIQLTGSYIPARRAYEIGLVQRLAPDRAGVMAEANAIADEILLGAPLAVQAIKRITKIARNVSAGVLAAGVMAEANAIADEILLGAPLAVQAIKRITKIARNVSAGVLAAHGRADRGGRLRVGGPPRGAARVRGEARAALEGALAPGSRG